MDIDLEIQWLIIFYSRYQKSLMAKIKFTAEAIMNALRQRQVNATNEVLEEAKKYAESISPTDTEEYIKSFVIKPARSWKRWQVVWELTNTSEYAMIIERWVQGKTYNYHRWPRKWPRKVIYSWVWNRTIQRAKDATRNLFKSKLAKW